MFAPVSLQAVALAGFIIAAFVTDIRKCIIPNKLCLLGTAAGFAVQLAIWKEQGLAQAALGFAAGFLALLLLYLLGAVGAGDVKLFGMIGALGGVQLALYTAMYSILYAGLIGLMILAARGKLFSRVSALLSYLTRIYLFRDLASITGVEAAGMLRFPFMAAVLPGVITAYFMMG